MNYKFLIYISYSYALPIGNPLESEIKRRGYTVKWFSDLEDGKKAISLKDNVIDNITDLMGYQPDVVLAATDDVPDFITGIKVQIFHGFLTYKRPERKHGEAHFRIRGFFDLYCTQGPSSTKGFLKQQKKYPHFEVIETGWSKVDPLFPIVNKEKGNTIMIASTFTERLSLAYNDDVYKEIESLSAAGIFNFIMVLHPKLPEHIISKWRSINNAHFKFYDTTNLIPLFKKADIMFADTTSAIQEFLLQIKPVVTFNHTLDHEYLIDVNNATDLENKFSEALKYPKSLLASIKEFVNELHPYNDGNSSQRIIDATIGFLHKDKTYLKSKPLNLIRKYKIRKRLKHFILKSYNQAYTKPKR
ncbi:CDP-glycerol glycerophosphotransferase [Changchengzhania lutea]|uniref:CDP-glycerol glycerophosphotransferase n=1 Tax=Changchengzhania lutea TaxID=2049305 RepID=UPI00115F593D|nr:CDP-glycerol glycerophosphotransferase [Changchengzhania lutea]